MSTPTQDKSVNADSRPVDNVPAGVIDNPIISASPIVNANPIVNAGPIVNANREDASGPIVGGSPIVSAPEGEYAPEQEFMSAGCTAVVPPGARKIYMIMVMATMLVGAVIVYGLFKLFDL